MPPNFFRSQTGYCQYRAQPQTVELEDEDVKAFTSYHGWLYSNAIFCGLDAWTEDSIEGHYERLVNLYFLGMRMEDVGFQDCVIDQIIAGGFFPRLCQRLANI